MDLYSRSVKPVSCCNFRLDGLPPGRTFVVYPEDTSLFFNDRKPKPDKPEESVLDVNVKFRLSQDSMMKLLGVLVQLSIGLGVGGAASIQWWKTQSPPLHSQPVPPAEVVRPQK
jgi:hypothetical protein